jgi:hypothetical protein
MTFGDGAPTAPTSGARQAAFDSEDEIAGLGDLGLENRTSGMSSGIDMSGCFGIGYHSCESA